MDSISILITNVKHVKQLNISYFELKNAHKHFTRYLSKDECLFNFTLLFLIKRELERFYKEELQRIIKKFNVGSTPQFGGQDEGE